MLRQGKLEVTLALGEASLDHQIQTTAGLGAGLPVNLRASDVSVVSVASRTCGGDDQNPGGLSASSAAAAAAAAATADPAAAASSRRLTKKATLEVELGDGRKLALVRTALSGLLAPCELISPNLDGEAHGGGGGVKKVAWTTAERDAAEVRRGYAHLYTAHNTTDTFGGRRKPIPENVARIFIGVAAPSPLSRSR